MNKATMVEVVGRVVSTRKEASAAVDAMVNAMRLALRSGEKVVLSGVGSLHVKIRKAKVARNLQTGTPMPLPPGRRIRFKMSKDLFKDN